MDRSWWFQIASIPPPSVPSVPQGVSARRTGSTTVLVTWMEPAVSFRELSHSCNTVIPCVLLRFTVCTLLRT